ncbi:uncharacterized protein GLRG_09742 [Colletotrichum graminicola M1.001]|uniref:Uncharacterized protein n=1 Tax=Colletotrichum graminicola (strain M1.001 / M2 / FGSC 10212) TaxID=645133 RepID=E3QUR0_COLGM|nr:uncharacterized protein GLRG_09742 [Colletotrichum graminicola M1.001]EFQ34598.1 hypothetical protein GLRG_09742 [Colletotrichum graminicola M1.001]
MNPSILAKERHGCYTGVPSDKTPIDTYPVTAQSFAKVIPAVLQLSGLVMEAAFERKTRLFFNTGYMFYNGF